MIIKFYFCINNLLLAFFTFFKAEFLGLNNLNKFFNILILNTLSINILLLIIFLKALFILGYLL